MIFQPRLNRLPEAYAVLQTFAKLQCKYSDNIILIRALKHF